MGDSLRDQLLKSGLAPSRPPRPAAAGKPARRKAGTAKPARRAARDGDAGEIDLARAWSLRQRAEAQEQQRRAREAEAEARARRERRRKLQALLDGQSLARPEAELARHFEYRGRIRRVHVTDAQLRALNAGELGVVQFGGRYLLVAGAIARQAASIDADVLALLVTPGTSGAPADDDGVPDDMVW
ncbi:MAG TPA: DUF2058 family protein [Rhodanobacteraceae bacterium]|nr:DUF2058 family protein [Rhodanobacteraceae bacterium]